MYTINLPSQSTNSLLLEGDNDEATCIRRIPISDNVYVGTGWEDIGQHYTVEQYSLSGNLQQQIEIPATSVPNRINDIVRFDDITTSNGESILLAGKFTGQVTVGPTSSTSQGNEDGFIGRTFFYANAAYPAIFYKNDDTETDKFSEDAELAIYPNPTNGLLNIQSVSAIRNVEVRDVSGRVIQTGNRSGLGDTFMTLDLSSEASGMYFITVQTQFEVVTKTISLK